MATVESATDTMVLQRRLSQQMLLLFLPRLEMILVNRMPQGLSVSGRHLAYGKKKKIL
jgi:hypothetical protein